MAKDPSKAIDFYTDVVGWKTQPFGEGDHYVMWVGEQGPLGGVMKLPDEAAQMGAPPTWIAHVQVENVDAAVSAVKRLGGKIHKEPEDIPTVGRFAVIGDPQGASMCVFTPNAPMTLHDSSKNGEICWNELVTSDFTAGFDFYSQLFGWKVSQDMEMGPMGTYRVFEVGGKQLGGMMNIPKGAPMLPRWVYYVETPDLDAALARAMKKEATLMNGPMDVPGGRIAQIMDSQGAAFALHQAAQK
jgi:predicted enzyme related to lactoylglutathione lyase